MIARGKHPQHLRMREKAEANANVLKQRLTTHLDAVSSMGKSRLQKFHSFCTAINNLCNANGSTPSVRWQRQQIDLNTNIHGHKNRQKMTEANKHVAASNGVQCGLQAAWLFASIYSAKSTRAAITFQFQTLDIKQLILSYINLVLRDEDLLFICLRCAINVQIRMDLPFYSRIWHVLWICYVTISQKLSIAVSSLEDLVFECSAHLINE